ncbi:hypothetical protein [Thaumasiovibrio subtropicus]|uniref:hypothetical protein n=1 Tax=Thaumasiovibrio subtropicus TaxID=1891207 RepID=UPI00131C12F0|nr:hypothetical protein [Thaumasiovibrio subtropicus]
MSHSNAKESALNDLNDALSLLALDAQSQVDALAPADVPEEILARFRIAATRCIEGNYLDPKATVQVQALLSEAEDICYLAFQPTNLLSMQQPEWEVFREKARALIAC